MDILEKDFRKMMGCFTTGVAIITTQHHGKPVGMTINTLASVSLNPPLVLFCLGKSRAAFSAFFENAHCAIHILSSQQQALCRAFSQSSSQPWERLAYGVDKNGSPLIPHSLGILQCCREQTYPGGDHVIFLNHVEDIHWEGDKTPQIPLVYYQGIFS